MAQFCGSSVIFILVLISTFVHYAISYHSPSSQRVESYTKHYLVEEDICHPLRKKHTIQLTRAWNSAIIIQPAHMFDRWVNRTTDLHCNFVIKVPQRERLMAVIQNMSFRRMGTQCLDYIKFRRKDQHETERFCGYFDRTKSTNPVMDYSVKYNNINELSVYGEFDAEGEIETTIFVSKKSLGRDEMPLNITIVYTPYKDCPVSYEHHTINLYRCLDRYGISVAEDYFCDGFHNCIADICVDEEDCPSSIFSNGSGTKVTIGAVTTILLCFIIFVMGLWICRKHKKLCWSTDCAGPSQNSDRFAGNDRDSANFTSQSVPSAPMLQVSVLSSPADKDLPPSYDSLFPEQANPSTT